MHNWRISTDHGGYFAKLLYELSARYRSQPQQLGLFDTGFDEYLLRASMKPSPYESQDFQQAILRASITDDDEIAHCLARVIVETPSRAREARPTPARDLLHLGLCQMVICFIEIYFPRAF